MTRHIKSIEPGKNDAQHVVNGESFLLHFETAGTNRPVQIEMTRE
jgi:hypothetical protein